LIADRDFSTTVNQLTEDAVCVRAGHGTSRWGDRTQCIPGGTPPNPRTGRRVTTGSHLWRLDRGADAAAIGAKWLSFLPRPPWSSRLTKAQPDSHGDPDQHSAPRYRLAQPRSAPFGVSNHAAGAATRRPRDPAQATEPHLLP